MGFSPRRLPAVHPSPGQSSGPRHHSFDQCKARFGDLGRRVQEGETLALGRHWQFWQFWCSEGIASTSGEEPYTTTDEAAAFPNETADSGAGEEPYTTTDETGLEEGEAFTSSTAAARPGTTPTACTCTAPGTATGTPVSNPHRCHTNRDEAEPHHGSKKQGQA